MVGARRRSRRCGRAAPSRAAPALVLLALLPACERGTGDGPGVAERTPAAVEILAVTRRRGRRLVEKAATIASRVDVKLVAEGAGVVVSRPAAEGRPVRAGELVLVLASALQESDVEAARARLTALSMGGGDLASLEEAQARLDKAEEMLRRQRVHATQDGILDRYYVEPGEYVVAGTPVARVVDPARLFCRATVLEEEILDVEPDGRVTITVPALPREAFEGRVVRRGRASVDGTGLFEVEIDVRPDERLLPGFLAHVLVPLAGSRELLLVPREALFERHGEERLFVVGSEDGVLRARERRVTSAPVSGMPAMADVLSGLEPGERVVVRGRFGLSDGDPVAVVDG